MPKSHQTERSFSHDPQNRRDNTVSGNTCYVPYADSESDSILESAGRAGEDEIVARFWAKVEQNGPLPAHQPTLGRCWVWTANRLKNGYGQFVLPRVNGVQPHVYAHRFAFECIHDSVNLIPDQKVCHRCDNPPCVRPSHLFLGTQADNLSDARRKGRLVDGAHLRKLTDAQEDEIRQRYRPRVNGKALAAEYGIHLVSLLRIIKGTQRVGRRAPVVERPEQILNRYFERVPSVPIPIRGEVR